MKKLIYIVLALSVLSITGCDMEPEALEIQKISEKKYSEEYLKNLREYKKSDHILSFAWYAAYAPVEGVDGYKDPSSWGERIMGLPDSLDICSLWMGIPGNDPNDPDTYAPVAYADWQWVKKNRGTRFVAPTIVRMNKTITLRDGTEYDLKANHNDAGIEVFAQYLVDQVLDYGLDGLDLDYEPEGDWLQGGRFTKFVQYIGQYFGPKGVDPSKLLIIDFYGQVPPSECIEYADLFIRQSYNAGNYSTLSTQLSSAGCPAGMFIVTENCGDNPEGVNFTLPDGTSTNSVEGMAHWAADNDAAGFGAFYIGRNYFSSAGPYTEFRNAIQIANPAGGEIAEEVE